MISERTERRSLRVGAGLSLAWLWISCAYLAPGPEAGVEVHPLAFNHRVHVAADLECVACHAGARRTAVTEIGLPDLATCLDCHEEDPEEEAAEVVAMLAGIRARAPRALWVLYSPDEELVFSHGTHSKQACAECHGDVANAVATGAWVKTTMETCVACHQEAAPEHTRCASCHRKIRQDAPPADHRGNWERIHGEEARFGDLESLLSESCSRCHERDTCLTCHRQVPPRDHTNYFRIRAHGLLASNDRQSCAACHQQDMCVRCHEAIQPASHRGSWGSPRDRHCLSCHEPVGAGTSCAVCHKNTPSHLLAPATPGNPTHAGATEAACRTCHPPQTTHPDNGDSCRSCHT